MINMNEENIIFQYQLKKRTKLGTRYYYFYATTDIENYLNNKDIKYVRYAKDTALNKQAKRIKELFKENKQLQNNWNELKDNIEEVLNMVCTIEHNLKKYEEVGLDHFDYALKKTEELKSYVMEILEGNNES